MLCLIRTRAHQFREGLTDQSSFFLSQDSDNGLGTVWFLSHPHRRRGSIDQFHQSFTVSSFPHHSLPPLLSHNEWHSRSKDGLDCPSRGSTSTLSVPLQLLLLPHRPPPRHPRKRSKFSLRSRQRRSSGSQG